MAWCLDGMPGVSTRRKPWRCRTETSNNVIQWYNVHVQRCPELFLVFYSRDLKLAKRTLIIRSTGMLEVLPKLSRDQESERAHQYANILQNPSLKAKHISTGGQSNVDDWCTAMHCHALHALRVLWQSERNKVQRCARPRSSRSTLANLYCKGLVHKMNYNGLIRHNMLLLFWTGVKLTQDTIWLLAFVNVGYSMIVFYCFVNSCSNRSPQNSKQFGRWHWWTSHAADGSLVMHCSLVPDDAVYPVYPVYHFKCSIV